MTQQVADQVPRDQYTATASQTVFPYTFQIFVAGDITVEQNGVVLTLSTHYTLSDVGTVAGGNVTLVTGADVGDIITVYRSMAFERDTDYQEGGDFLAQTVDIDFNRLWLAGQQNRESIDRGLHFAIDDVFTSSTLPDLASRQNKILGFDSSGDPITVNEQPSVAPFLRSTTLAAAIARSDIYDGAAIVLDERTTGNGGGITFDVVLLTSVTPDGVDIFASTGVPTLALVAKQNGIIRGDNGDIYRVVGCVLRNTGSGWFALDDSGHKPIGVASVSETAVGVEVNFDFVVSEVITVSTDTDETLASLGLSAGASVALTKATVSIFGPMKFLVNTTTGAIVAPSFFGSQITANTVDNVCTIAHPSNGNSAFGSQAVPEGFTNNQNTIENSTTTGFDLRAFTECAGLLTAVGGSWTYSGRMKNAATTGFGSSLLTVTHDSIDVDFKCQLTPRRNATGNTNHIPVLEALSGTTFGVFFKDFSGTIQTPADNDMSFTFNRGALVEAAVIVGNYRVDAGVGLIIPADLVAGSGNIWFYGLFKVTSAQMI